MRNCYQLFRFCLSAFFSLFGLFPSSRAAAQSPSSQPATAQRISIPLGGNAWGSMRTDGSRAPVDTNGITGFNDASTSYTVWFRVSRPGPIDLSFVAAVPAGSSSLSISISGVRHVVDWRGKSMMARAAGRWQIVDTGYQAVDIRGLSKSGPVFADIRSLELSGTTTQLNFVPNNEGNFFYWGRRGPSVHLNYALDTLFHAEWFYNEVTVPPGQDIPGSYFMADGFNEGYFGMQVNSATERRILFSVWSPFATDDPKAIPDSLKIVLVRKGEDVHAGAFGDEGSGGQSYLVYPWIAGNTYRFLLRAEPASTTPAATTPASTTPAPASAQNPGPAHDPAPTTPIASNHIRYTAWFFAPESGHWRLIASWDRPATHTWLTHLHSFLENFEPEAGDEGRLAHYNNQWVGDSAGHWIPLTHARFTADNTARKGYRLDYAGGEQGGGFFLRNGGFFSTYTPIGSSFTRPAPRVLAPPVDTANLPI
jgi:hypothetical protein